MIFLCYPKCTTCQKAQKWLDAKGIPYETRHIKEQNPTETELRQWHQKSDLPLKKFFNTSGLLYKEKHLKEKLPLLSEDEMLTLLAEDGMLVMRPMLIRDNFVPMTPSVCIAQIPIPIEYICTSYFSPRFSQYIGKNAIFHFKQTPL